MDFANRNNQHRASAPAPAPAPQVSAAKPVTPPSQKRGRFGRLSRTAWFKVGALILLFGGTILVVAMLLSLNLAGMREESKLVAKDQMQAVFVNVNGTNGGQVYFGKIKTLTNDYIQLENVYYIQNQAPAQTTQQADSQAYNLVKLGCELHGPDDLMVINRAQVFFWENLKNDSQVSQKAAEFVKNNPNGQNCSQNQQQSQTQGTGTGAAAGNASPQQTTTQAPAATTQTTTQQPTTTTQR